MHFWLILLALSKIWNAILVYAKYGKHDRETFLTSYNLWNRLVYVCSRVFAYIITDVLLLVFVLFGLYGKSSLDLSEKAIQYSMAAALIIMSRRFMAAIAKFPAIGPKVYMLTKVCTIKQWFSIPKC